jgi:hypothetical protein
VDVGAAAFIRQKIIDLRNERRDPSFRKSWMSCSGQRSLAVIAKGRLSPVKPCETNVEEIVDE